MAATVTEIRSWSETPAAILRAEFGWHGNPETRSRSEVFQDLLAREIAPTEELIAAQMNADWVASGVAGGWIDIPDRRSDWQKKLEARQLARETGVEFSNIPGEGPTPFEIAVQRQVAAIAAGAGDTRPGEGGAPVFGAVAFGPLNWEQAQKIWFDMNVSAAAFQRFRQQDLAQAQPGYPR